MPSPDLSEFRQFDARHHRKPCKVARALDALEKKDKPLLEAAIADRSVGVRGIEGWCRKRGIQFLNNSAITSHRNRKCECYADNAA